MPHLCNRISFASISSTFHYQSFWCLYAQKSVSLIITGIKRYWAAQRESKESTMVIFLFPPLFFSFLFLMCDYLQILDLLARLFKNCFTQLAIQFYHKMQFEKWTGNLYNSLNSPSVKVCLHNTNPKESANYTLATAMLSKRQAGFRAQCGCQREIPA